MKLSQTSLSLLESTLRKAIEKFPCGCNQTFVTDIHLQVNTTSGELSIFDDEDKLLANAVISEWVGNDTETSYTEIERILSEVLHTQKDEGNFDKLPILKPFSFVLVDEEKETIAELLLMDEDTLLVSEGLLKGLDEELDAFLKELLTD